ncbi:nuclear transport factor 2 family protein [Tahibacter caeni]|uniref:nuclear transport factor 2 family protein n=1 Tax=Tahibacter caeni TaxID=1453545 RepID=UPI0021481247|nr:nuclear transport factor 2 family protein [Tahibacter caeni]
MKLHTVSLSLVLALIAAPAFSHGKEKHDVAAVVAGRDAGKAELQIAPAAADAVAVVERFSAALSAGNPDKAAAELDPAVLILESGGVERSRDEYLAGHAKADADFLKGAQVSLTRRTAQASGELAWIGSESAIHAKKGADVVAIDSTETMVLRKTAQGWKIVHIHWSSRRAGAGH